MRKAITVKFLEEIGACSEGYDWFIRQDEADSLKVIYKLLKEDHWEWANWLIVRLMTRKQYLSYAIFAAREVLGIYEKNHPGDDRPRKAIEAAEECLRHNTQKNKEAASYHSVYAYTAYYAAYAAYAADSAAYSDSAADAADSAAYAAYAADSGAYAYRDNLRKKIINYGRALIEGEIKP